MKAITICQPYAHLILTGEKWIENRTWPTRYRGPVLIHAGQSREWLTGLEDTSWLTFGALVGVVDLVDCRPLAELSAAQAAHEHATGPWCWVLDAATPFPPMPYRGQQGLFEVPASVVDMIRRPTPAAARGKLDQLLKGWGASRAGVVL